MVPSTLIKKRSELTKPRRINKPDCVQRTNYQRQEEIKGRRRTFPCRCWKFTAQITSTDRWPLYRAKPVQYNALMVPSIWQSQMTVFEPSTDCSIWERDKQTERRAVKGNRAFGGEEGGGREGCRQLLTGTLSEPAGTILQWVSN